MFIIKHITHWFCSFKEFFDRSFIEKRHAKYAEYIKSTTMKIMFDNSDKTICCDRRVYLDSNSIFGNTPKRFYMQMLLDPFKEQLYLPSVYKAKQYV